MWESSILEKIYKTFIESHWNKQFLTFILCTLAHNLGLSNPCTSRTTFAIICCLNYDKMPSKMHNVEKLFSYLAIFDQYDLVLNRFLAKKNEKYLWINQTYSPAIGNVPIMHCNIWGNPFILFLLLLKMQIEIWLIENDQCAILFRM